MWEPNPHALRHIIRPTVSVHNCPGKTDMLYFKDRIGGLSELADEHDLGSCAARRVGSTPTFPIKPHLSDHKTIINPSVGRLFF